MVKLVVWGRGDWGALLSAFSAWITLEESVDYQTHLELILIIKDTWGLLLIIVASQPKPDGPRADVLNHSTIQSFSRPTQIIFFFLKKRQSRNKKALLYVTCNTKYSMLASIFSFSVELQ